MTLHSLQTRTLILSAILGCLGVFSGYALFVLVREQLISGRGTSFLLAVLVAGIMSFAIEWVRDVIRHGREEPLRFSRVIVTIFTLMMFEIFVIALHEIPSWHLAEVSELPKQLLGDAAEHGGHPLTNLFLLTGIWLIAGAVLAATLSWSIFAAFEKREQAAAMSLQVARSTRRGIGGGAIAAPLAALAAVLLLRIFVIAKLYFLHHAEWRDSMHAITMSNNWGNSPFVAVPRFSLFLLLWLDGLWGGWMIGPLLTIAVYVGLLFAAAKADSGWPITFLIIVGIVVFFQPLVHDLKALFAIPLLAALVWSIPGLVLGALNPLLRRPSELPREWGILACVAAGVLLVATWSRFNGWWIFPVILLLVAIVYFRRGVSVEEYWPFVALSVAIIVAGATSLIQYVSFAGVLRELHQVNSLPAYIVEAPQSPPNPFELGLRYQNRLMDAERINRLVSQQIDQDRHRWIDPLLRSAASQPTLSELPAPTTQQIDESPFTQNTHLIPQLTLQSLATTRPTTPLLGDLLKMPSPATHAAMPAAERFRSPVPSYEPTPPNAVASDAQERAAAQATVVFSEELTSERAAEPHREALSERALSESQTARLLEICLSAAFAFWCTVAMLAAWAMLRAHEQGTSASHAE